jgi:hypothetical protein
MLKSDSHIKLDMNKWSKHTRNLAYQNFLNFFDHHNEIDYKELNHFFSRILIMSFKIKKWQKFKRTKYCYVYFDLLQFQLIG